MAIERLENRVLLSTYLVTNNADSGAGSLRQAITDSNATPGAPQNEIDFQITGGSNVIALASPLPSITAPVYLNGTTQSGYVSSPLVQVNGYGLSVSAGGSKIQALDIVSTNSGPLITLAVAGSDTVQGCWLGLDLTGNTAVGNSQYGIYMNNVGSCLIGGTTALQRNVISGSTANTNSPGVYVFGLNAMTDTISGNYIGTNATATAAVGNAIGIDMESSATHDVIGGTAAGAGNVIAGNTSRDIEIGTGCNNSQIQGNLIGLNAAGTTALNPSSFAAVDLEVVTNITIGGTAAGARNILSGHQYGVYILGYGGNSGQVNTVQGDYIGTDITGTVAIGNSISGVYILSQANTIGGTTAAARNIIAGNAVGITVAFQSNTIEGNWIGLSSAGAALGNVNGVVTSGSGAVIGGAAAGAGNVISGNTGNGVVVGYAGTTILGNLIGTNTTGAAAIPNLSNGIIVSAESTTTIGGTAAGARNVISGNKFIGIRLTGTSSATGNLILNNYIGLNAAGTGALGNGTAGISIEGPASTTVGAGNVIAFNGGDGIDVTTSSTGNKITQNSIYSNGGIGIDLNADGPTPNHGGGAITGPNNYLNHPVVTGVTFNATNTAIAGTFNSAASSTFTIEFFASPIGSGTFQGKTYLGNTSITTDVNGNATFNVTAAATAAGQFITATATDSTGDTSEFSLPATATAPAVVSRLVYYNDSVFDGRNPAANASDDNATAPNKVAYIAGAGNATTSNYTSYSNGLNGLIIDVANLSAYVTASDLGFLAGTTASPAQWTTVPAPTSILVRPGAGVNGSTRINVTFADGSIVNEWLRITVLADADTGLASPDVFYFGNLVGQAGEAASNGMFTVTSADEASARADLHGFTNPATIADVDDFNRDGLVNISDQLIARNSVGHSLAVLNIASGSFSAAAQAATPGPTSYETYFLQLINQARANPAAAAAQFGIDLNEGLPAGTISSAPEPPLAFNAALISAAESHSAWMLANQTFSHNEGSVTPVMRMQNAGYVFASPSGSGENLAAQGTQDVLIPLTTLQQEFESLFVDSSTAGRSHRVTMLTSTYEDTGVGVSIGTFEGFNALLLTQDFAYSASSGPSLTGVAYNDARIHDNFYEPGEGLGGITITAVRSSDNATFSTTTWASGAYTLSLPAGTYAVTATGAGLGTITKNNIAIGTQNVEQDFVPTLPAYVAGRYIAYNDSVFDGNTTAPGASDDAAIAIDKTALLPGVPASFANYTSYVKGINAIVVDIAGAGAVKVSDFTFEIGNTATPSSWTAAPATSGFLVRPGAGVNGSTRIEITWADGAIRNKWLQITIAANADTNLTVPDVFYFGNAVGSSGATPASGAVTVGDQTVTRSNLTGFTNPAPITDNYDYNRDGRVDISDEIIARDNAGFTLVFFTPPDPSDPTLSAATPDVTMTAAAKAKATRKAAKKAAANADLTVLQRDK